MRNFGKRILGMLTSNRKSPPEACYLLLQWLEQHGTSRVLDLPAKLQSKDILLTCDRYQLVTFVRREYLECWSGRPSHHGIDGSTIHYEDHRRGWWQTDEFSVTDPKGMTLDEYMEEDRQITEVEKQLQIQLSSQGQIELSEWRLRNQGRENTNESKADEMTLAQAALSYYIPKSAWTKAAKLPVGEFGHLPTRTSGRNRYVTHRHAKQFADMYEARREQRRQQTGNRLVSTFEFLQRKIGR